MMMEELVTSTMTKEEAAKFLAQSHDQLVNYIVRVELDIEKCKKARGPNLKKMKERAVLLTHKVEHVRISK